MNTSIKKSLLRGSFTSNATAQQPHLNYATSNATTTQQPTAKPSSLLDLARNTLRNNHATSSEKDAQQAHSKQGMDVARSELTRLVRFCAEIEGFTEEEHKDALEVALADFDSAKIFFTLYKDETLSRAAQLNRTVGTHNPQPR
ncbi:MAG: hypothetical protein H0U72_11285 [Nitrosospira sp.]|nr:hypothetical protein [Nitrosospira sp.]